MILDLIVCGLLAIAVATGLWTMQSHHEYFSDFTLLDLCEGRLDGWIYVLNLLSTAWCVVDFSLRFEWMRQVGWTETSTRWQHLWLAQHAASACLASLVHILTYRLLSRAGFCQLCRRPWGDGDID